MPRSAQIFQRILESHQNSTRQKVTSKLPYPAPINISFRRTKFSRHGDPAPAICAPLFYAWAVTIQTKLKKQQKVNRKSRPVWGACCCGMLSCDWTVRFACISNHVPTQLEKSRPAHNLQIEFFKNNINAVQMSERRDHARYINSWNSRNKFSANRETQL